AGRSGDRGRGRGGRGELRDGDRAFGEPVREEGADAVGIGWQGFLAGGGRVATFDAAPELAYEGAIGLAARGGGPDAGRDEDRRVRDERAGAAGLVPA